MNKGARDQSRGKGFNSVAKRYDFDIKQRREGIAGDRCVQLEDDAKGSA